MGGWSLPSCEKILTYSGTIGRQFRHDRSEKKFYFNLLTYLFRSHITGLNSQQLKHFGLPLRTLQIVFPGTNILKFSGGACLRTLRDAPAFGGCLFEAPFYKPLIRPSSSIAIIKMEGCMSIRRCKMTCKESSTFEGGEKIAPHTSFGKITLSPTPPPTKFYPYAYVHYHWRS